MFVSDSVCVCERACTDGGGIQGMLTYRVE